jgi:hypothetical protein
MLVFFEIKRDKNQIGLVMRDGDLPGKQMVQDKKELQFEDLYYLVFHDNEEEEGKEEESKVRNRYSDIV